VAGTQPGQPPRIEVGQVVHVQTTQHLLHQVGTAEKIEPVAKMRQE
jgi:hypothetical protein